ncbi:uncharacterized protein LOC113318511 [Papaver somniferum]|uniref:uncharacterized protein LOC113318511 n=1 Tax=Papaver somniferum TaxID=3469 RepID=UPI000E703D1A|nr:uncharacterized protein LOC113318511 [Papaver somniferum]
MRNSLNVMAANKRLLEAAIREKELADMASFRDQLQREQGRARGFERQLAVSKGKVKSLEEDIVQLKNNEDRLNARISHADAASTELTRQLAEAKEKYEVELTAKIKEGVKKFIEKRRAQVAAKKSGSASIPPNE